MINLSEVNQKLKSRYDYYQSRLSELQKKTVHINSNSVYSSPNSDLQSHLKNSLYQLESLKREKDLLDSTNAKALEDLQNQKKAYLNRLNSLKHENTSLKSRRKSKSISSIPSESSENSEILSLKKKIMDLENTHNKNQEKIKELQQSVKRSKKFPVEAETSELTEESKLLSKLQKTENQLQNIIRSNETKYKQIVKELEGNLEKLNSDKIVLQMKILKTTQQERLLQMTIEQDMDEGHNQSFADANFLYKPSIKALYH